MNGYNFTDRVRRTLQMAREEAQRLHLEYVSTEPLLLGLLHDDQGIAVAVLTNLGVDPGDLKASWCDARPMPPVFAARRGSWN